MTRRIEQVEGDAISLKRHHAGSNRNPALLLDFHPVRARPPLITACLYLAGKVDRAALQQQLFRQRGLTRIGVRDDCEGSAV